MKDALMYLNKYLFMNSFLWCGKLERHFSGAFGFIDPSSADIYTLLKMCTKCEGKFVPDDRTIHVITAHAQ